MSNPTIGFIGGGRITRIFLEGWKRANALPSSILISEPSPEALGKLTSRFPGVQAAATARVAAAQDVVFLAVHPPALADVAAAIKDSLRPQALVVSLAPKFTTPKLTELLGGFARVARVIPNAPSVLNLGFNPVAFAPTLTPADKAAITALFTPLGECPEVAELKLEAYAILTAMGPTYLWFQLQALREVATGFGLSDAEIVPALKRMVCGSTRTLLESGLSPTEVLDLVPVKPLADLEAQVSEAYRTRLPAIYAKIKP